MILGVISFDWFPPKKHNIAKQMPSTLIVNNIVVFNVLAWKCWRFHLPWKDCSSSVVFRVGLWSRNRFKNITVVEINGTMHGGERMWLPLDFKSVTNGMWETWKTCAIAKHGFTGTTHEDLPEPTATNNVPVPRLTAQAYLYERKNAFLNCLCDRRKQPLHPSPSQSRAVASPRGGNPFPWFQRNSFAFVLPVTGTSAK